MSNVQQDNSKVFNYCDVTLTALQAKTKGFSGLNSSEKQALADAYISTQTVYLQNDVVEYILQSNIDCMQDNAPFSYDDITNNYPTASIELVDRHGSTWYEDLTEDEAQEKASHLEYLLSRYQQVIDNLQEKFDLLEDEVISLEYTDNLKHKQLKFDLDYLQTQIDRLQEKHDNLETCKDNLEQACFEDYPEIFQWFLCSDHLINALEKRGECTLNNTYWGRQCCGQSIILDHVIQSIAFDYWTKRL